MTAKIVSALLMLGLCRPPLGAAAPAQTSKKAPAIVGIGLEIKIEDGYPVVESLIPGGPAVKDGRLQHGDRIEGVAEGDQAWQPTAGLKLAEVVAKIRGPRGSKVSVRATRPGDEGARLQIIVELKRDILKTPPGSPKQ
jgi:carboxyl-terminal processing protease